VHFESPSRELKTQTPDVTFAPQIKCFTYTGAGHVPDPRPPTCGSRTPTAVCLIAWYGQDVDMDVTGKTMHQQRRSESEVRPHLRRHRRPLMSCRSQQNDCAIRNSNNCSPQQQNNSSNLLHNYFTLLFHFPALAPIAAIADFAAD
jgi:hypothetical protein